MGKYVKGLIKSGIIDRRKTKNGNGKICRKIIIAGLSEGCGSTQLTLMMAKYYSIIMRKKVAIIDLDKNNDYTNMMKLMGISEGGGHAGFIDNRITYYPGNYSGCEENSICKGQKNLDLSCVMQEDYDYIIMDVGNKYRNHGLLIDMCDERYIVVNASVWKISESLQLIKDNFGDRLNKWNMTATFGDEESFSYISNKLGTVVHRIPFIKNPFKVSRREISEIAGLFGED